MASAGDGEVALGRGAPGAERGSDRLRRVGDPFGDRGDRPRPGQDRGGRHGQDGDQGVAAATGTSRVGNGSEVGQQARGFGVLELPGIGVGTLGEGGRGRG
jgi:hypothetical protein